MGVLNQNFQVTLDSFHALRDERPKEEKWELIGGTPVMMPPPTLMHQRISRNIETLLNRRLAASNPEWSADREIGILLPDNDRYNPEPDVLVIDRDIKLGQIYTQTFYFVAEVLSENDKRRVLELKREFYCAHAPCRGFLFVRQDRVEAELVVRGGDGWAMTTLEVAADRVIVPDIGDIGALAEFYCNTPLWPNA